MPNTADTPFFSKSNQAGNVRWQFTAPPAVVRGYLLDLPFRKHLSNRWYLAALVRRGDEFDMKVIPFGSGEVVSLDPAFLSGALENTTPVLAAALNVTDMAQVTERFERAVSCIMHNLLDPIPEVGFLWTRLASTNGENVFSPP